LEDDMATHAPTPDELLAEYPDGAAFLSYQPNAVSARYDAAGERVVLELSNGCEFAFPARLGQGLQNATDAQLAAVTIICHGTAIEWPDLGIELAVHGLLEGRFGTDRWMRGLGLATGIAFV
jgi:hypothetical protein